MDTQKKKLMALLAVAVVLFGGVALIKFGNLGSAALWRISDGGTWLLPLVTVAALIDSVNPCAFSILLLTIAFLLSMGSMRSRVLTVGAFYILGIFVAYLLIGLGILQALHLFNTPHFMAKVGASLLIAVGLIDLLGQAFPNFPLRLGIPNFAHGAMARLMEKASLPAVFILGALVGLCEFPCTGGPYLMVLGLLHDQGTYLKGLGYLIFYNLVFIVPLGIILLIASNNALIEKVREWKKAETGTMRMWGGVAMVLLGILMFLI